MKRFGKRLLILIIISGFLFGGYYFFVRPTGYTSQTELARVFFEDMSNTDACSEYFNPETETFCNSFTDLFDGQTVTIDEVNETASGVQVTLSSESSTTVFTVTFVSESVAGVRGVFHNNYYLIDTIQ